jgi:hypothetical protein
MDEISRPYAVDFLGEGKQPVAVFVSPANTYPRNYRLRLIPPKILVFSDNGLMQISFPEKKETKPTVSYLNAADILMIKSFLYLLYGKLQIWSVKSEDAPVIDIEYNTVAHNTLHSYVQTLIELSWNQSENFEEHLKPDNSYEDLFKISFSFYNGILTEGLHKDETVFTAIYQPEIYKRHFGLFTKKISPNTSIALTNKQIIILHQDIRYRVHHEWLFTFIPRFRCGDLHVVENNSGAKCQIEISKNFSFDFLLDDHRLQSFQDKYFQWRPQK